MYLPKSSKHNSPLSKGTELFNSSRNQMSAVHEYRRIPVVFDGIKVSQVQCENVSRVKEMKQHKGCVMKDSISQSKIAERDNKIAESTKNQHSNGGNIYEKFKQAYTSDNTLCPLRKRVSVSEPNLLIANDRGDCITKNPSAHYEEFSQSEGKFCSHATPTSNGDAGINGSIYIKKSGKIYKSMIIPENIQNMVCTNYSDSFKIRNIDSLSNCKDPLNKRHGKVSSFKDNRLKFIKDGLGEFEIAIILSGINHISENTSNKQNNLRNKMSRNRNIHNREKFIKKSKEPYTEDKNFESSLRKYPKCSKNTYSHKTGKGCQNASGSKLSLCGTQKTNHTHTISAASSDVSNSDISDNIEVKKLNTKCTKQVSWKNTNVSSKRRMTNFRNNSKCKLSESSCTEISPQSGVYAFDENNLLIRPKISEEELWKRFENVFRSYASTSRHSGEVIPRIISTRWMLKAGVVDDFLTKREAYDAFSKEAGTKITMNAAEYKGFLLRLTKRLKLPYYVIYHRMCQVEC